MKRYVFVAALLLAAVVPVSADEQPSSLAMCGSCHGSSGEGNAALGAPRLAGQQPLYLLTQLQNFKAGRRGYDPRDTYGSQMRAILAGVDEREFEALAAHFAGQELDPQPVAAAKPVGDGAALYQGTCAACHGPDARGFSHLKTPDLSILTADYIDRQLLHYQQELRGADAHADQLGIWMRGISLQIETDAQRAALVDYIGSLSGAPANNSQF
jgi:cytochrome c oxidase subunit 2